MKLPFENRLLSFSFSLVIGAAFTLGLGQSLLPQSARCLLVQSGEKKIEHFRVPANGVTLDTLLDIL